MAFALALLLALAVWKPWDTGRDEEFGVVIASATTGEPIVSDGHAAPSVSAPPTQAPTQPPTPAPAVHPDAIACISDTGWRAVTRDVTAGRESRTWIAVDPGPTTGPEDEAIPTVRIVVGRLIAIGYCVPAELADDPRGVRLWRIQIDEPDPTAPSPIRPRPRATPIPVSPLQTLVPRAAGFADMFGPPRGESRWTAGRYVFAIDQRGSVGQVWFSIEVVDSEPVPDQQTNAARAVHRPASRAVFSRRRGRRAWRGSGAGTASSGRPGVH